MNKNQYNKKWMSFNLNDYVLVKLNQRGYKLLADKHNQYLGIVKNWERRDAEYYERKANSDGYTGFQAWDFIQKFGDVIGLGSPNYFDLNILIEKK